MLDVGHRPVTRVTLARDLTALLEARRATITLYTSLGVLGILAAVWLGIFQFEALRMRLERSFAGRLQSLRTKARAYDEIRESQVDAQAWKAGLLSELVLLVKDPLAAVDGALAVATGQTGEACGAADAATRQAPLAFAAKEIRRLSASVDDRTRMIATRDDLRRVEPEAVDVASLVGEIAREAGGVLPRAADLPCVLADRPLLQAALRSLVQALQRHTDPIPPTIEARRDGSSVVGSISAPGTWSGAPDQAVPFGATPKAAQDGMPALARLTFERFGGTLDCLAADAGRIGFTFSLAAA